MKRVFLFSIIALTILSSSTRAADFNHGRFGIGIVLGKPTGLSAKYWFTQRSAVDATLGWDFSLNWLEVQTAYLYHFPISGASAGSLAAYAGAGCDLLAYSASGSEEGGVVLALRIPVGLEYIYKLISFYAEVDPLAELYPSPYFAFGGGIGFRLYF